MCADDEFKADTNDPSAKYKLYGTGKQKDAYSNSAIKHQLQMLMAKFVNKSWNYFIRGLITL